MCAVAWFFVSYSAQAPATNTTRGVYALEIFPVSLPVMVTSRVIPGAPGGGGLFLYCHNHIARPLFCCSCSESSTPTNFSIQSRLYQVGAVFSSLDTIRKRSIINTSQFSIGCTWPFKYMRSTFKGLFVFILCVTPPPVGSLSLLSGQPYPRSVPLRSPANLPGRLK